MIHKGLKSTDAEIILDLEKGQAIFDYSLNKFQEYDSNSSCLLHEEGTKKAIFFRNMRILFFPVWLSVLTILIIPLSWYGIFSNKHPKYQYRYQKMLKNYHEMRGGIVEESIIGKQESKQIKFVLPCNIWFEYKLDGDFNLKIKKISLLRRFVKTEHLGITSHIQSGWNLIFEFKESPDYGNVVVRYLP